MVSATGGTGGSVGSTGSSAGTGSSTGSSGGSATGTRASGRSGGGGLSPTGGEVAASTGNRMSPEQELAHLRTKMSETSQSSEGEEIRNELKKRIRELESPKGMKAARKDFKASQKGASQG